MRSPATSAPGMRGADERRPDAGRDPHALGTWVLQMGFDLWLRSFYNRAIVMPDDFHIAPGTLIASNHQRDADGPMLGTILVCRRGLRFRWPLPYFATREDLFRPGILARLTVHWPRPLSALLGHVSLAWFFPLGHAEPMRRVHEFTFGETLHALIDAGCGDEPCGDILNARGLRELHVPGAMPLQAATATATPDRLEQCCGLRRVTLPTLATLAPTFRATVAQQLAGFTKRLDRGQCIYFAPEGTISMDGQFGRIRAGFFRLARAAETPPWIQPMALAYDTLAPGRSRVVVYVGKAFRADTSLDRRAFDATLRRAIARLTPVTPSHLLARYLMHGPASFTQAMLARWIDDCVTALRTIYTLDPMFGNRAPDQLANRRLRWLERRSLVVRQGETFRNVCQRDVEPGWQHPAKIARLLDNQLASLVQEPDRLLPC